VHSIREVGKEALAELRRQLGFLGADGGSGVAPMPGLGDLPALVERCGATLHRAGEPAEALSPGVELAVYRVVQEALTNAGRHASGARTEVRLVQRRDAIEIEVTDSGGVRTGEVGSGRGLAGMRERVEMYGGLLDAAPNGPGWRVHAWLPSSPVRTP
jgi:signal transduction histidine kinase